jgi:hypothetical protein
MKNEMAELRTHFFTYLTAAAEAHADISARHDKNRIAIYNFDYSSIYPTIWGEKGLNPKYDGTSRLLFTELRSSAAPFGSVITSPSFWELLDSVRHHIERAECTRQRAAIDEEFSKVRREIKEFEENVLSASDAHKLTQLEARRRLDSIRNAAGGQLARQLAVAESLIGEQGPLKGFADLFPGISLMEMIPGREVQDLFQDMWRVRSATDDRPHDDKSFRYWVDTLNICICRALSRRLQHDVQVNFVTKASHKSELCDDVGRSPHVPFFWLKAAQFPECGNPRGLKRFFKWMKNDARVIHDELDQRNDFPTHDGDRLLWEHIKAFMQTYLTRLMGEAPVHAEQAEEFERLRSAFKNPRTLQEAIDSTLESAHKSIQEILSKSRNILGDELINYPALTRNDVLLRTRKMFER